MTDTSKARALALVGMPGSGKSSCAYHLEQRGFWQFRFGGIVEGEVRRRGMAVNPENEKIVREELRATHGMAAMAKLALDSLHAALDTRQCIVIDGLYSWSEYKYLRHELKAELTVVAVVCRRDLRYQRLAERPIRPLTAAEAESRDWAEIENLEKGGPIAIADYTLTNDGSAEETLRELDALLDRLGFAP
ncbi:MAG: AAA family ATPase [Chloroflexi bacterium]|nr:AAA family ATPase [Chloroflexota bacterium]